MKYVIVEDEQLAAKRLERLITELRPEATMVQWADSIEDAVAYFKNGSSYDLVFMDIQLADGESFEIFNRFAPKAPTIFTTAYDHYAIQAFKQNSIDYLLKPIESADLEKAIVKYETYYRKAEVMDYSVLSDLLQKSKTDYKSRFLVKTGARLAFIPVEDIAYIFSDEGSSFICTHTNDRYLLESILEDTESQLDPKLFFRINRKMIAALSSIKKIEPHHGNRIKLELAPVFEEEVFVSRQRTAEFKEWLDS